jgi:hypothetical protein
MVTDETTEDEITDLGIDDVDTGGIRRRSVAVEDVFDESEEWMLRMKQQK